MKVLLLLGAFACAMLMLLFGESRSTLQFWAKIFHPVYTSDDLAYHVPLPSVPSVVMLLCCCRVCTKRMCEGV